MHIEVIGQTVSWAGWPLVCQAMLTTLLLSELGKLKVESVFAQREYHPVLLQLLTLVCCSLPS